MRWMFAFALLAACSAPEPAPRPSWVEPAPPLAHSAASLTLAQALEISERANPELAVLTARIEAAEGRREQAGAFPNPRALGRTEGRNADDAVTLAGVGVTLPIGGRLSAAEEVEARDVERLTLEREVRRTAIRSRVQAAFAAVLYAGRAESLQTEAVTHAGDTVNVAKAREAAGDAVPAEVARAEMQSARARLELGKARALRDRAMVGLIGAIGDAGLRVDSVEGDLEAALQLPALESVVTRIAESAGEADVRLQQATIEWIEAQRIPDVSVELLYRHDEEDGFDVGVGVELPLFDRKEGRLREARADLAAARARARASTTDLTLKLREAYARLSQCLEAVKLYQAEIVPRSETVLKAALARYDAGDDSLATLLPVRREAVAIQLDYLETLRDAMAAWAELAPYVRP